MRLKQDKYCQDRFSNLTERQSHPFENNNRARHEKLFNKIGVGMLNFWAEEKGRNPKGSLPAQLENCANFAHENYIGSRIKKENCLINSANIDYPVQHLQPFFRLFLERGGFFILRLTVDGDYWLWLLTLTVDCWLLTLTVDLLSVELARGCFAPAGLTVDFDCWRWRLTCSALS
jgi:hypothetical protein